MDERDTPDLPPSTNINGAVVEEWVKAGGYGTVYRARDKLSGTLFAIKFIPLYRAEQWAHRESIISMPFRHRNLVQQVGFGYWPHVVPRFMWLKMLYIEGRELDEWAWEENPDARAIAGKLLGVARGLAVVHDQRVVHRDVKESNILVRDDDGEPVLLDFGAARRDGQTTITQGMFPPGTSHYRSPEAWLFGVEKWNEREAHYRPGKADDLYALGVVLYRLLTGRLPFEVVWEDMESVKAVIHQVPLPPRIVNPRVPESLSGVCMTLLEKKPENRYPSALALHDALKSLLARADASWRVPLHEGPRAPRKGRRAGAARKKHAAGEEPTLPPTAPISATPTPITAADFPVQAMALQALRRAAIWMAMLVGIALAGWWLVERRKPELQPPPVALSPPSPTLRSLLGQEVASSWTAPEIEQTAAPFLVEKTPAVVASLVTRSKDDALKKQQAPSSQGNKKQKGILSPMAKWCVGAAAAANTACPGAQVRTVPEAEACPAGAVETMTETLGITLEGTRRVEFPHVGQHKPVPVQEGSTSVELIQTWQALPPRTILQGRLFFRDGRIYGRFTEARTPKGDTFKVCLEIWQESKRGAEMEPGSGADTAQIFSIVEVMAVERFE
jgi:eukaryotic-like serine/threonine-protein kinase